MKNSGLFSAVHALVGRIPAGKVMTYGQIAYVLGGGYSARYVGFAMSGAPAGLPCHRVVNRLGQMAPGLIFGGEDVQRAQLMAEGVPFLPNGRIDLVLACFDPYGEE